MFRHDGPNSGDSRTGICVLIWPARVSPQIVSSCLCYLVMTSASVNGGPSVSPGSGSWRPLPGPAGCLIRPLALPAASSENRPSLPGQPEQILLLLPPNRARPVPRGFAAYQLSLLILSR